MKKIFLLSYAIIALAPTCFGQDRIYWGDQGDLVIQDKIGSVNASDLGSELTPVSTVSNPSGIAYYHANPTYPLFYAASTVIYRDNLAGTANAIITPTGQFNRGVVIDYVGKKLYWANSQEGYIARANLDGSGKDESFITGQNNPWDLEIDPINNKIYWSESHAEGDIKRANLSDGTNIETLVNDIDCLGIAVDPLRGKLYYTEFAANVYAANLDGSDPAEITGLSTYADVDVDVRTGKIYLVNYGPKLLTKANADGTDKSSITASGLFIAYADVTSPVISSIVRKIPSPLSVGQGGSGTFRVTFSEPVMNVDAADFEFAGTPTGTMTVTHVSLNTVYDIRITNVTGTGSLDLDASSTQDVVDFGGNVFGGTIMTKQPFTVVATPAPLVTSFDPASGPVGATVVITGANFSATPSSNIVMFNGTASTVTASSVTSITTTVPVGATSGLISVTVSTLTESSASEFIVCTPPPTPIITGEDNILTSSAETGNQWLKNEVEVAGATSKTLAVSEAGDYTVRVTVGGCASVSEPFAVSETDLSPEILEFSPASGPVGTSIILTGKKFSALPAANAVTFNGVAASVSASTSTSITTSIPATTPLGAAAISVTVNGRTGTSVTNFTVTCTAPAKPIITIDGITLSSSSDNNNQWLKNGVEIAGATNQTFEAVDPGAYSVKVSSGDCSTESDPTTITAAGQLFSSAIKVYPNPAHSLVRVELQAVVPMARVDVYTLTGIKKESIFLLSNEGKSAADFDVKSYAAGLYVLIITSPDGTVTKKLRVLCCAE